MFEAVINSIQSLETVDYSGNIEIKIVRSTQRDIDDSHLTAIERFVVTDDGPGFDQANYDSFCTADSRFKEAMGGKGIGRFIWLKAFSAVNVESVFSEGDDTYRRGFAFCAQEPPIQGHSIETLDEDASLATTVIPTE
jgi:hypothetical protein